ncbi:uncharacterized protein [Triticum aestivum]|uniref:uncharacterized protein n=1 Tax=Triticum aestivum TaxID=4565 RepID=UPI001D02DFE1|nr:uncharacterized protein LOC123152816 [Triticum aestivum]
MFLPSRQHAALGVLHSPHTQTNLPSAPDSHLSSSNSSSILALSGSFRDVLAFAATCRSWRAAFSSYPNKSAFCTRFPPLLVQFNVCVQAPDLPSNNGRHELRTCKVIDPINKNIALRCQIPQEIYQEMHFAGTSYGQLICGRAGYCLVVDVFSGAVVSPPRLPFSGDFEFGREFYFSGTLTAPIASPNSHLLVSTAISLFDWPVGSDSWSELQLSDESIEQIVEFNGQFAFAIVDHIILSVLGSVYILIDS